MKNNKKTTKRRLKPFWRKIFTAICLISTICVIKVAVDTDNRVFSSSKIAELEQSNPQTYADVKAMISDEIEGRIGTKPEKVVFYVVAPKTAMDYTLKVYYKVDYVWYTYDANWLLSNRISNELDARLVQIALNGE